MLAYLAGYVGQLGAMLDYLEGYVGRSWGLCRPILKPMAAHVDPCWTKRYEKWEQQKNTVKRRIFWWLAAYLAAMLAYLGAMLAYLEGNMGASWGYVGPSWGYIGPSWGLCWPILGLCWPILGAMLAHLEAMLAHLEAYVGPCWPIWSHMCDVCAICAKDVECHRAKKHCKLQGFLSTRAPYQRSAAGGAAPLSYGEERNAYGYATARGPLAGLRGSAPCRRPPGLSPILLHASEDRRRISSGFRSAQLRSKDPVAGLKHHGSEGRIGPAARSPDCQTLLSEPTRN